MQINKSVMVVPGVIGRDELFALRMNILQLYKCRAYAELELPTSVAHLVCKFDPDNAYKLELVYKNEVVLSFHPSSKILDFHPGDWDTVINAKARGGNTLGWTLCALFDLIYREHQGYTSYVYANMTTAKTRRNVKAFYGLLHAAAKLSSEPMMGERGDTLARHGDGYAIIDTHGMIVCHVYKDAFYFGMGYLEDTDFDKNIEKMILKYRPWAIDLRRKFGGQLDQLSQHLREAWRTKQEILRTASNALSSSSLRGIQLKTEYAHTLPSGTIIRLYDNGIVIQYNRGGLHIGNVTFDPKKSYPTVDTSVLDYLRSIVIGRGSIKNDFGHLLVGFANMLTDQVVGEVEQATLKKLDLSLEKGHTYYEAFMKVRGNGYRGDFESFATLLKQVQG